MDALLMVALALQDLPRGGIEVTSIRVEGKVVEDLAVTKLTIVLKNTGAGPGEADFRVAVPPDSVVADVDSTGGVNPDIEAAVDPVTGRSLVRRLRRAAVALAGEGEFGFGGTEAHELPMDEFLRLPEFRTVGRGGGGNAGGFFDPSLVEKAGDRAFRVSLWPLAPDGALQTLVLSIVHPLRKTGGFYAYEFPLQISGLGHLPKVDVSGQIGGTHELLQGSLKRTSCAPGGKVYWAIRYKDGPASALFDAGWARERLAARDNFKAATELKIAGGATSIVLSDTRLHAASGIAEPKSTPPAPDKPVH